MTVAAQKAPSVALRRRRALAQYLQRILQHCVEHARSGATDPPTHVTIDEGLVPVSPWAMSRIHEAFRETGEPWSGDAELLCHGVALQMKIVADRQRLDHEDRSAERTRELFAIQAELMLDTAIGMALTRELQKTVNRVVQQGQMDRAKHLTRFHHEIRSAIGEIKNLLAASEQERAESLCDNLTDEPRVDEDVLERRREQAARKVAEQRALIRMRARAKRRASRALAKLPSRTEFLFAALAILLAAWLGFVKAPELFVEPPPAVAPDDLPRIECVLEIRSLFPSLYLVVDSELWQGYDDPTRLAAVESASAVAASRGFSGLLFRTDGGRPVAQWNPSGGARLIAPEPGAEPPPAPEPSTQSGEQGPDVDVL